MLLIEAAKVAEIEINVVVVENAAALSIILQVARNSAEKLEHQYLEYNQDRQWPSACHRLLVVCYP